MTQLSELLKKAALGPAFNEGKFGIEKEGLRVTESGKLALTPHPTIFGNRSYNPHIQTDFSESQLELVTAPTESTQTMNRWLMAIHDVVERSLPLNEYIWPMSMPIGLPAESDIQVAQFDDPTAVAYREHLAEKYGKKKQMVCGIHYNYEINEKLLIALFKQQTAITSLIEFKSHVYMKLAKNFLRYRWLLTYLLGASPVATDDFYTDKEQPLNTYVRSIRSSHYGYVNSEDVKVSFESLETYISDIQQLVATGVLSEEKEFYSPVRIRGTKKVKELASKGIQYLEFRIFDLNPYAAFGMTEKDMEFIHLFLMTLIWLDETATVSDIEKGKKYNEATALAHPYEISAYQAEGLALVEKMQEMIATLSLSTEQAALVEEAKRQLLEPKETIAGRLVTDIEKQGSYQLVGLALAKQYKAEALEKSYNLRGFEGMELSTQLLMFDSIQKGIEVEILDESEQFLKLTHEDHVEYVKNANMTSKDQYIAPLIMENKVVTKKVLESAGFHVPAGAEYETPEEAKSDYWNHQDKGIVIKPKSTNYGLGISIFKDGASKEDYELAVDIAFKEDRAILVEEFIDGTEYRFFVLGNETRAIMLRMPANVVGDGERTIQELVAIKNQDPLRGTHHRSPLELIQLGEIEQLMLKEQGFTIDSIPATGTIVYLRENSNISTGGDSFDLTDEMDESYKKAAVEMTKALGATISGVDLIIPDRSQPSTPGNPGYAVIEANFNPAMHMHTYPYQGKGRRLTRDVLDLLFPELEIRKKKDTEAYL
ncbi:bifunctional glutamate--cysteine ligase/glutathione synthetase [Carnobacterium divergens]|uniref:bifunctional glutamate--cysteine ligase GshA/glutathione synthetase GshB n=1 Tax=Carnobacterium divergens TaxID=2748 RepID=UPI001071D6C6|nr:bifunctional glutamate--cysteine ligase GshA/glutathione synthetase GshB [Carnobacterium divergens]MDT1996525.1 bifunctional glutamate--cysteine ligase GshA/glutathione synthetase GshB [Carnobacterium divergens]TFI62860.1 bifunctional glutamate--cysteine ligase/glutathione synthetase [Carnobacterium divergens]TFI63212.1 bifunctional glutamate--cysteine ligase/glutathione synthetase [Carnobacterium divergens]TFI66608.1 bifunctional glutamate--cysteine ligase/glutathione synthetase [Carnobacte